MATGGWPVSTTAEAIVTTSTTITTTAATEVKPDPNCIVASKTDNVTFAGTASAAAKAANAISTGTDHRLPVSFTSFFDFFELAITFFDFS